LGAVLILGAVLSYERLRGPQPIKLSVSGDAPGATKLEDGARPDTLHVDFSGSAARLDQIGKPPGRGVELWPSLKGHWLWESDRRLSFTPSEDWGVGQDYRVRLDPKLFPAHVKLEGYEYRFKSAPFSAQLVNTQFYIDPKDPRLKQIVATVKFSHIVDTQSLEKRVSIIFEQTGRGTFFGSAKPLSFTVSYNKFMGEAYIRSENIAIPPDDARAQLSIGAGVHAARGGGAFMNVLGESVRVPGMYEFFHVNEVKTAIAHNERYEPEQVLILETAAGVQDAEMAKGLSVWVLPKDKPATEHEKMVPDFGWYAADQIGREILALSTTVAMEPIPAELEYSTVHTFRFKAPPGRHLFIKVEKGLQAYGGYVLAKTFEGVAPVPAFPKELKIMHDGAILNLSGEHKLSVFSQELSDLNFELGRVLPSEINHLASQTEGDFARPVFENYRFGQDDITERFTETRALQHREPGRAQYTSFDFSKYLEGGHRGLFFFRVEEWDAKHKRPLELSDARLILITDLGLLVKENADGSRDVFVQSLATGQPAAETRIEVVGKNGLAVVSAETAENGRAHFPKLADFTREKTPTVYVARRGEDLSFLPFDRADRRIDYSRFDVGGVMTSGRGGRLQAYLFSDRGIYRPGDLFHVAYLVRALDWNQPLAGMPLETVVTDARGLEVQKQKVSLSTTAFEEVSYKTDENAPTGSYQVGLYIVKDGRRSALLGSTSVRVEEFLSDRLRINTHFSEERTQGWVHPDGLKARASLSNLFGTPAEDRRLSARLSLTPSAPAFKDFPGFDFFDPALTKKGFSENLTDARTDAKGEASFDLDLGRFAAGTYRLLFSAEGFEAEGGRGVVSESSILVSPRPYLIGLKSDGDLRYINRGSTRSIEAIALGPDAHAMAVEGLKAQLIEERWVSVLTKQNDGTYRYQSVKKETTLKTWPLALPAVALKIALATGQAGDFALVIRDGADLELNREAFTIIGKGNLARNLERNAELQVRLDKADYAPGDEIQVAIRAPYVGAGLITIERDHVFASHWFKTGTTASVQTIRVPDDLEGNAYINVSFLRSTDSKEIFMSPLSYGVAPFTVSLKRRALPVELDVPEKVKPGEKLHIRFRADRPSKIAVYAVDEGILQVAGYQVPDPLAAFFKKRALEVRTFQILDLLLPEFSVAQAAMAPGGDKDGFNAIGKNLNPFKRKRDKPAVFWSSIISAGPEWKEVVYEVPDSFNGSLRVMAVAATPGAIGVTQKKTLVRGPFVLSPNAPTFAAPGDEFEVSVGVANGVEGSGDRASVKVSVQASGHLQAMGALTQTLTIGEGHEGAASFKFRALAALGSARLVFTAALGTQVSHQAVELSVRPPIPYLTTVVTGNLKSGRAEAPTPRRMYPHFRVLEAAVSTLPLGLSRGLIQYLVKYPYGCTEQLISEAFPALILRHRPEFGYAPEKVEGILSGVLHMLQARQTAEGAFGFWAGNSNVSNFQAVYALHFLTEARDMGYTVPADLVSRGLGYLNTIVANQPGTHDPPRLRAYALYVLTRNGQVTTPALESLRQELEHGKDERWRGDLTGIYMAATYSLLHIDYQAESLIKQAKFGSVRPEDCDYEYFYDGLVHDSQLLYILARHFPQRLASLDPDAVLGIVSPIMKNDYNTLSSAYAILALDAYAESLGDVTADKARLSEKLEAGGLRPLMLPAGLFPVTEYSGQASAVEIEDTGKSRLFYQVTAGGFDLEVPKEEIQRGIEVQREYRDAGGHVVSKGEIGGELSVHLKIRALEKDYRPNMAIVDLLPAGFEVVEDRKAPAPVAQLGPETTPECEEDCGEGEASGPDRVRKSSLAGGWTPDYVDVREDRVVLFGSVTGAVQEYVYRIKATNKGSFMVPPPFAESMYDRSVQARGLPARFDVE
jgi:hypothetical protein